MIYQGDCLDVLKEFSENSIDSIITDPPYGLSFMGKKWDSDVPSQAIWEECLRVLKPGGHLLAFAGTRTQHRMAVRIEDAGFEIRDMIAWIYGSGFPKSLNIGKAVDKINGEAGRKEKFTEWMRTTGITANDINEITGTFMGSHYLTAKEQPAIPTAELWAKLRPHIKIEIPKWVDELVERIEREREVVGKGADYGHQEYKDIEQKFGFKADYQLTKGTSEWEGWGTALKPALEPITVARKPISEKTIAENVLKWNTGGINIDGSRVEGKLEGDPNRFAKTDGGGFNKFSYADPIVRSEGRFPANLIHDGSEEIKELFPETKSGALKPYKEKHQNASSYKFEREKTFEQEANSGNASRFFYCAKASKSERDMGCEELAKMSNHHPTVKPIALMEYLVKLVTPKGGIVLDPFAGSGSTLIAAEKLGFNYIGIELNPEYIEIANKRLDIYKKQLKLVL